MRVILITLGSAGDVLPMVGLGHALSRQGHEAIVVSNGHFREDVEEAGLEFIALGSVEDLDKLKENPDIWHWRKGMEILFRECYLPMVRPVYDIIERRADDKTVVVSSIFMFGARIAHEKLKMPFVTIQLQPAAFWSVQEPAVMGGFSFVRKLPLFLRKVFHGELDGLFDRIVGPEVNRVRASIGLGPVRHIISAWALSPQRVVGLFPEWYASPPADWPEQTRLTGFPGFDRGRGFVMPDGVEEYLLSGEPPVVFTLGTAMHHGGEFFRASIEASRILGRRAMVLTLDKKQLPESLPDWVEHFDYLPFGAVLPRTAALVHHGGIGTVAQGLAAGIPQLVMPMNFDQPDNAARIERLGVGAGLSPARYTAEAAARKLDALINDAEVAKACRRWSKMINRPLSVEATCREIVQAAEL